MERSRCLGTRHFGSGRAHPTRLSLLAGLGRRRARSRTRSAGLLLSSCTTASGSTLYFHPTFSSGRRQRHCTLRVLSRSIRRALRHGPSQPSSSTSCLSHPTPILQFRSVQYTCSAPSRAPPPDHSNLPTADRHRRARFSEPRSLLMPSRSSRLQTRSSCSYSGRPSSTRFSSISPYRKAEGFDLARAERGVLDLRSGDREAHTPQASLGWRMGRRSGRTCSQGDVDVCGLPRGAG